MTLGQAALGIWRNQCPKCSSGPVFSGIYKMHAACPHCGMKFEKEPGYFLGALVVAYFLEAALVAPIIALLVFYFEIDIAPAVAIVGVGLILLHPILNRVSKLGWLYLEQRMTQALEKRDRSGR